MFQKRIIHNKMVCSQTTTTLSSTKTTTRHNMIVQLQQRQIQQLPIIIIVLLILLIGSQQVRVVQCFYVDPSLSSSVSSSFSPFVLVSQQEQKIDDNNTPFSLPRRRRRRLLQPLQVTKKNSSFNHNNDNNNNNRRRDYNPNIYTDDDDDNDDDDYNYQSERQQQQQPQSRGRISTSTTNTNTRTQQPSFPIRTTTRTPGGNTGRGTSSSSSSSNNHYNNNPVRDNNNNRERIGGSSSSSTSTNGSKSHFFSQKTLHDFLSTVANNNNKEMEQQQQLLSIQNKMFQELCSRAKIDRPSKIQSLCWPTLLGTTTQTTQQQQQQEESQQHVMIADQTGSGKTLAYLIPLLHRIMTTKYQEKQQQQQYSTNSNSTTTTTNPIHTKLNGAPRCLILAPTAELADQIHQVCQQIIMTSGISSSTITTTSSSSSSTNSRRTNTANADPMNHNLQNIVNSSIRSLKCVVLTASGKYTTSIRDQIRLIQREPIDLLIATPGRLSTILRTKNMGGLDLVQQLRTIVFDEVDVLFVENDPTFGQQIRTVGAATYRPNLQFIFVTATLPDTIIQQVEKEFGTITTPPSLNSQQSIPNKKSNNGILKITGPGLHRVAPTVQCQLIDVSVPSSVNQNEQICFDKKSESLLICLRQNKCSKTLIFCNTVRSCRQVENLLSRYDRKQQFYTIYSYHNAMTPEARNQNLQSFSTSKTVMEMDRRSSSSASSSSSSSNSAVALESILVCTDRAARGIDFDHQPVDHVVLFDFPHDPAEYLRRVGRTARAGRNGICTVLAYGWQLPIARSVLNNNNINNNKNSMGLANDRNSGGVGGGTAAIDLFDQGSEEYTGGVRGRQRQKGINNTGSNNGPKDERDELIGKNIARGKLWKS